MRSKLFGIITGKHWYLSYLICFIMLYILTVHGTSWASVTPQVAGGWYRSIALKSDGTVWAWGSGGTLGDGTTEERHFPVQASGLSGVTAIAGGEYHTIALKSDGTVWAWGFNEYGELGDETTTQRTTPVQVNGLSGVTAIAAGKSHSVSLKSDGTVWAWGRNASGELGDGTTTQRTTPGAGKWFE